MASGYVSRITGTYANIIYIPVSDTYNPVPGVIDGVPSSRNYDGGFASTLMVCDST